jgi:predicted Zn-dependent peptidase
MTSREIAEKLDFYGSYFDVNIDRDWCIVSFVCLSKFFSETLALAEEILIRPAFPEKEVRTYCDKSKQSLTINRTKVDFNARELLAKSLYGTGHPYGVSSEASCYDNITNADLKAFYDKHYTGRNCFVVMSGDTCAKKRDAVGSLAASLPSGGENDRPPFPEPVRQDKAFMPFEGAVQSAIRIGKLMFPRQHPDYIGMQVVTTLLGGYFGSRLIHNLREEHGYTYGIYSAMVNFDRSGYMAIATEVGSGFTEDAVKQIFIEIERMRTETVPEEELSLAKNIIVGEVMRILDGPFGIADVTIENLQNNIDNTYLARFVQTVRDTTPAQVLAISKKYLTPEGFTTVIVGPER